MIVRNINEKFMFNGNLYISVKNAKETCTKCCFFVRTTDSVTRTCLLSNSRKIILDCRDFTFKEDKPVYFIKL